MNAYILKSANRLYKLFKVYATVGLLGGVAALVIQIVLAEPVVLIAAFMVLSAASIIILLWAQSYEKFSHKLIHQRSLDPRDERPPILPESLMIVSLPADISDQIIGDLRDEFYHLRSKYGRYSAVTWYTIQSGTIFTKAAALHCGLSYGKSLTQFLTNSHPK
jgi:hypothetical protein